MLNDASGFKRIFLAGKIGGYLNDKKIYCMVCANIQ